MARIEGVDPARVGGRTGVPEERILALPERAASPLCGGAERPAPGATRPAPDGRRS
ncbi:MAG TPA: hypothetical protein VIM86_03805 [Thermodesulfobacteriota bacterium]